MSNNDEADVRLSLIAACKDGVRSIPRVPVSVLCTNKYGCGRGCACYNGGRFGVGVSPPRVPPNWCTKIRFTKLTMSVGRYSVF